LIWFYTKIIIFIKISIQIKNLSSSSIAYPRGKSYLCASKKNQRMKISYNWLKSFLPSLDKPAEETAAILTDIGLEVEKTEELLPGSGNYDGVIVGRVIEVKKHPNADKLSLTLVDLGDGEPVPIVCGAPNVAQGQKVPVATVGTTLKTIKGETFKIKKSKIRGEVSYGMICAEDELGLSDNHDGIMVLDDNIPAGTPFKQILQGADTVFEIGLTPNRADAMSHFGVARDLKAKLITEDEKVKFTPRSVSKFISENRIRPVSIEIRDEKKCPRYVGLVIQNVKVEPSPAWLQERLRSIGIQPKNNIVDVTNFVLHDIGQPMHAFDLRAIRGNKIVVRPARKDEKITALDDNAYTLTPDDLVIANESDAMAIAGVIGGKDSAISESTTDIFLESAYFDPVSVRKTAKRLGIQTDSSYRFERGIDPEITEFAIKWAAILIKEMVPDAMITQITEETGKELKPVQIGLSYDYIHNIIGEDIGRDKIKEILSQLDFKIILDNKENLHVEAPLYRVDVTRPADVIEEILRIYGYNKIHIPEKIRFTVGFEGEKPLWKLQEEISNLLTHNGFTETMSPSMYARRVAERSASYEPRHDVELLNPVSAGYEVMRQNIMLSVLQTVKFNIDRQNTDLSIYEWGKNYTKKGKGKYEEQSRLALAMSGHFLAEHWMTGYPASDFYHLKGMMETIARRLGLEYTETPFEHPDFTFAVAFVAGKKTLAFAGKPTAKLLQSFGIKQDVFYGEWNTDALWEAVRNKQDEKFRPLPKYPAVRRDLALLLDKPVSYAQVYQTILSAADKRLRSIRLFDVYEGDKIPAGKKSYAVSLLFRSDEKTLNDKEVDKMATKILKKLEQKLGASLRS